jgi:beta-glucanase (GH16 family)
MNKRCAALLGSFVLAAASAWCAEPDGGWALAWSDEFDGAAIDGAKWRFDRGSGFYAPDANVWVAGWGNNELQFYTERPENAFVKDGVLHLRALKEPYDRFDYTSARIHTKGLFDKTYGRFEFRARLPAGPGLWPALWLLPSDNSYGAWAASGEVDVMEARGQDPSKVLGTIHYGSRWPKNEHSGAEYIFPDNATTADFHVYSIEWERDAIRWYVDGRLYSTQTSWWSCSKTDERHEGMTPRDDSEKNPWPAPFDKPFHIVMNLAVGGKFPGAPDAKTLFPAEMLVDFVRVYDRRGEP